MTDQMLPPPPARVPLRRADWFFLGLSLALIAVGVYACGRMWL